MLGNDQFEVVTFGMGTDGHTASLFPQAADLRNAIGCAESKLLRSSRSDYRTPSTAEFNVIQLLNTRSIILHVTGSAKREVLEQAWATQSLPIASILRQELVPLEIYIDQPLELV